MHLIYFIINLKNVWAYKTHKILKVMQKNILKPFFSEFKYSELET